MSRYNVRRAAHRARTPVLYSAAGVITALVLMAVAYRAFLTIPLTIDGSAARLVVGTQVSDLWKAGRVHGTRGNLVAAQDHKVLKAGGGNAPYVLVNGRVAATDQQLYASDVVKSMNGTDVVEPLAKRTESLPAPTHYQGKGALETVLTAGKAGVREIVFGSVSKEVVSTRVMQEPVAQVVERSQPAPGSKVVALTFDDGPWPNQTQAILGILQKYGVKATFFEIGSQVKGRPQLTKMLADAGMLIGDHSETHPRLAKMAPDAVAREIEQAETNIQNACGQRPRYFRPPGGNVSPAIMAEMKKLDMKLVEWDIDTKDWKKPGAPKIVSAVLNGVRPGAIVLMHDGGGDRSQTIQALPAIIEGLKKMGYQFVTIDGIASPKSHLG